MPPSSGPARSPGAIAWYYLATPVFVLMDFVWGVNIRVSALDDTPALKYAYYALCLAFGGVTSMRPGLSSVVGVVESSLNVLLLVLGMMLPYYRMLETIAAGKDVTTNPYRPEMFVNFFLSAAVWVTAFYRSEAKLFGGHSRS
jgi:hypothetical protein